MNKQTAAMIRMAHLIGALNPTKNPYQKHIDNGYHAAYSLDVLERFSAVTIDSRGLAQAPAAWYLAAKKEGKKALKAFEQGLQSSDELDKKYTNEDFRNILRPHLKGTEYALD